MYDDLSEALERIVDQQNLLDLLRHGTPESLKTAAGEYALGLDFDSASRCLATTIIKTGENPELATPKPTTPSGLTNRKN